MYFSYYLFFFPFTMSPLGLHRMWTLHSMHIFCMHRWNYPQPEYTRWNSVSHNAMYLTFHFQCDEWTRSDVNSWIRQPKFKTFLHKIGQKWKITVNILYFWYDDFMTLAELYVLCSEKLHMNVVNIIDYTPFILLKKKSRYKTFIMYKSKTP